MVLDGKNRIPPHPLVYIDLINDFDESDSEACGSGVPTRHPVEDQMVVDDRRRSPTQRVPQPTPSQCASPPAPAALTVPKTETDYWAEKVERRKKKEADKLAARLELERLKEELDALKRLNQPSQPISTETVVPSTSALAVAVPKAVC